MSDHDVFAHTPALHAGRTSSLPTTVRLARRSVLGLGLAAALSGCVGGRSSDGNASTAPAAVPQALPAADTRATITVWSYIDAKTSPWVGRAQKALKAEFPNVTVKYTFVPYANMAAKLLGTAVSGGGPDGIFYNPSDAAKISQAGVLADMTGFFDAYADKAQFPDSVVWRFQDKVISLQGYVNTTALYYNKTILDSLGLQPPTTVAELGDQLAQIKAAGQGGMTMCATPTAESEFQIFCWMLGEGLNYGAWDKPKLEALFGRFDQWIEAGYVPRDVASWTQGDAFNKFSGGRYAFSQNGNWNLTDAEQFKFEWGVAPIPAGSAGSFSIGGGEGFSIGAKTANAALTWRFFELALLTIDAEKAILKDSGSIPVRQDAAQDPVIQQDPNLATYSQVVASMGARPSTPLISDYLVITGKIWNALAGGQISPAEASDRIIAQTSTL